MSLYDSKEAISRLGRTDPEFAEYSAAKGDDLHPAVRLPFSTLVELVRQNPTQHPPTSDHETVIEVPMRDGHRSNIRVYKPTSPSTSMFVLIHGGGFCLGHNAHPGIDSQALSRAHGITVVSISYRLAPESKFPTAPNDVWDTLRWVSSATNARSLGMECLQKLFLGGSSAGANLAAVTAQRWVIEKLQPPVSGIWLNAPMLLHAAIVPERFEQVWISRKQNANAMILNENALSYIETAYAPDILSPQYSPFNNQNPHQRLPPVYFQIYGQDPLRDDGLIYEKVLRENGVQTRLDVYPGIPHCFADVFKDFVLAEKYQSDNFKGIGWLLGKVTPEEG